MLVCFWYALACSQLDTGLHAAPSLEGTDLKDAMELTVFVVSAVVHLPFLLLALVYRFVMRVYRFLLRLLLLSADGPNSLGAGLEGASWHPLSQPWGIGLEGATLLTATTERLFLLP